MIGINIAELIKNNNLYPIIPITGYNKLPFCKWSDPVNHVENAEAIIPFGDKFEWVNSKSENKKGIVTGYALITGKESNIMVLDLDVGHNEEEDGIKEFDKLLSRLNATEEDRFIIKNTLRVRTPSGGIHLYFKYRNGLVNKAKYFPGIDIRTDGGIIILPFTSVKVENKTLEYKLVSKEISIMEMPESVFNAMLEKTKETEKKEKKKKEKTEKTRVKKNKYFSAVTEGSRNQALMSFLGMMLHNPTMRNIDYLLPIAEMYNETYINPKLTDEELSTTALSAIRYEKYPYTNSKGDIIPNLLANHLILENSTITLAHDVFRYNNEGFYSLIEESHLQREIFDLIPKAENKTTIKVNEVIKQMKVFTTDTKGVFDTNRLKYINCKNGIYDIENGVLLSHSSDIITNVQIQAHYVSEWKEKFENSRFFKEYLPSIVKKETFKTIQQCIATTISPRNKQLQGMWALIGDGKNGKSAFSDLLIALVGKEFVTSIELADLEEDKFITSSLVGAIANINPDDSADELRRTSIFKKITAGDTIMVQKKGVNSVSFTPNVTMVHGFNRMPHSKDKSDGYARRWFPIPFNHSFGTEEEVKRGDRSKVKNPALLKHIFENEMDLIFMWAIEGLHSFNETSEVYLSNECLETLKEYRLEIDNVRDFIDENYIIADSKHKVLYKDIYDHYRVWCANENIAPHKKKNFGKQLEQIRGLEKKKTNGDWRIFGLIELQKVDDDSPF